MIRRIATARQAGRGKPALALEVGGRLVTLEHDDLATYDTAAKLLAEVEKRAERKLPLFFHLNRDGSVAVATGAPPAVWPEDDQED